MPVDYDFRRPIQLSREHQRVLTVALDGFARQATTIFTSTLRTICQVTVQSIDQRSYAEYVESLDQMTYLTSFSTEPMPGQGVLELPLPVVMSSLDHMLGGPGSTDQPRRALSDIEETVIGGLVSRLLEGLRYSLSELVTIEPVITDVEYSPQFAQVAGSGDVMVVVALETKTDKLTHRITVCLPFNGLLPHLNVAVAPAPVSNRERTQRAQAAQLMDQQFREVPVDVTVRLRETRLDPGAIAGLRPGDVLRLGHPASAPLDITVDGTVFAHASAGTRGTRLAALIVATPQENK
ncbi:flagellar motor switch protein FliM [Nocardioides sp.]|uniref:flagellar motor switch protein FliM n=1 Tax=Nocardioides sp. TaxID=35761 RepID=UPI0025E62FDF|nr:flagellar motor switch protein FliM [Nocardioides sp.]